MPTYTFKCPNCGGTYEVLVAVELYASLSVKCNCGHYMERKWDTFINNYTPTRSNKIDEQ